MAKVKAFKELDIQELTEYYGKRGGFKVESVVDSPVATHIEVTDIRGDNPLGWIIPNRFYYESSGEIVDPIHDCIISIQQMLTLLDEGENGRPATIGEHPDIDIIYFNLGCWEDNKLILSGLDEATEIMFSIYYGRESFSQLFLHQIKPTYRSKMIKAQYEGAETPRRHSHYYERIVLPLPQEPRAYKELLEILEKLRKKQHERMQDCIRYLDRADVHRKNCAKLGSLAKLVDCIIDTKSDPFHVILQMPEGETKHRYDDEIVKTLTMMLCEPACKRQMKAEEKTVDQND